MNAPPAPAAGRPAPLRCEYSGCGRAAGLAFAFDRPTRLWLCAACRGVLDLGRVRAQRRAAYRGRFRHAEVTDV